MGVIGAGFSFAGCPMRDLGSTAPWIHLLILALYMSFACLRSMLPHLPFFFTFFLYLSFPFRMDPLRFQAEGHKRRPNLGFFSCFSFLCYSIFCVADA